MLNCGVALTSEKTIKIPPKTQTEVFRLNLIHGNVENLYGLNVGIFNSVNNSMIGAQVGIVNLSDKNTYGWQFAIINMAEKKRIIQDSDRHCKSTYWNSKKFRRFTSRNFQFGNQYFPDIN
ncbi:hypothetical protein LEP1GSC116_2454 [Leptospira interrogans serovar Icterohaemorrhagiae str. Verdun HP]|uniref:Uncharacterized protein n=1 Tax=Leptospira interrogans serovar Icterohaemorrhagiae str. Verdun HP TaxID=1049910 RepID=M6R5N5_LEPIR|nr:hypothetical protein LEP1GSC116_2454 [Leptospira interrogans serovar Icterohaemorrhagiae str. Verdun HP]